MRTERQIFWLIFILIIAIAVLHIGAVVYRLYWSFWWMDILTHFLGGLWVGTIALYTKYFGSDSITRVTAKISPLATSLLTVLLIGLIWEIFEYIAGVILVSPKAYVIDTSLDILMDIIGGLVSVALIRSPQNHT
jgi:hypothetical protein